MKKRWLGILLALCLLVCLAPAALATETEPSVGLAEVYVSAKGDDTNGNGSQKSPYATLAKAVNKVADGGTVYVMSDLTMTESARFYGKDITITSGDDDPYTVTRGESFNMLSDNARSWYNPAMIEVGSTEGPGTASLTLTNITFDDDGKKEGEYFIQADSEGDGETVFGKETIGHGKIVQDAIIATYNGTGTITLGEGATLKNYGGMSAVRLAGGKLVMKPGSVIMDDENLPTRTKGTTIKGAEAGLYGPAGSVWVQSGIVEMQKGSLIENINGRVIYSDGAGSDVSIAGTIQNITGNSQMWQGDNGSVAHIRNGSSCTLADGCLITNDFSETSKVTGAMFSIIQENSQLRMENGAKIQNWTGTGNVFFVAGADAPNLYKCTLEIDGEISRVNTGGNHIVQATQAIVSIKENAYIHHNKVSYGSIYIQGGNEVNIYGKINYNYSTDRGGAIAITNHGDSTVNMYNGAELVGNYSKETGGGLLVSDGTFTMYGGTISDNVASLEGGGVFVRQGGSFVMKGGRITDNITATVGGGIAFQAGGGCVILETGTITDNVMKATVTSNETEGTFAAQGGDSNDISITSTGSSNMSTYCTVDSHFVLGNPDVYMQKYGFTLLDPQRGTKLGNASTDGETALKDASIAKGWSNTLLASFWAQADNNQTWVLSGLEKAADKEKLPVYALVMPTDAEGNVGTNTATVYAVTVNADGTWSFTVPGGNTTGYVVGLVQPTTNYGTLTLVANPATLTEGVGGTVNYTATYKPADNLISQLADGDTFTLTITLAPGMTYVANSFTGLTDATVNENTITVTGISKQQLEDGFTAKFSATAPTRIKAGDTFVTNAVLEGTITVEGNEVPVTLVANATVEVTPKPEDPIEPTDPPYIPPVDPDEPADPDDTGVSDLLNTEDHIQYLFGYPDGTFGPENNMTRAEVAQMFYNLLLDQDVEITKTFDDVPANAWYTKAVNTLASLDIISGVGDNKFEPERSITRAEFTAMAMKFAVGGEEGENIFSDVDENDWFYDAVVNSIQYGWIHGYGDGTFRPNNPITRAEVTAIVNNMLGRAADEDFVDEHAEELTQFSDIEKHWAYYHIVEATNDHDYTKPSSGENWTKLN